jgi:predicted alpha/beta superfamily hydrolase
MRNKKPYRSYSKFSDGLNRKVTFYFYSTLKDDEEGPLLIMHDGQNLFDDAKAAYGTSWGFIEALNQPDVPKMRVLGISNAVTFEGRCAEYSPFIRKSIKEEGIDYPTGGKGDLYLNYVMTEVLPHYKDKYPTTKVYMGGSSLGGLITLAAILSYPNELEGAFGLSNAFWVAEKPLLKRAEVFDGVLPRFYLDIGTEESDDPKINLKYAKSHEHFAQLLSQKPNKGIKEVLIEGGKHHESDWAKRLSTVLSWLIQ